MARARRKALLRANRHRLRYEELEDCFSQAVTELVGWARAGGVFDNATHAAAALETRFYSRVIDRQRALKGRGRHRQRALAATLRMAGNAGLADPRSGVEELVMQRLELRNVARVAPKLTDDQRLVVATQVGLQMRCGEFCRLFGWSAEKYRKVAQRARVRLRVLTDEADENELDVSADMDGDGQRDRDAPVRIPPPTHGRVPDRSTTEGQE